MTAHSNPCRRRPRRLPALVMIFAFLALLGTAQPVQAAEATKTFDVPAGPAIDTLKLAAQQAGKDIMFPAETVAGVQTAAVKGEYTVLEAFGRMLAPTKLAVVQDEKTGALSVTKAPPTPAEKNVESRLADSQAAKADGRVVKLEGYEVLGTRIRQTDFAGPSPVNSYSNDEIRATGALSLSEFLRTIPQIYNGVTAGRNSAPDDLNLTSGQRTEAAIPLPPSAGSSPSLGGNAPVQTGVSGASLRGLGAGSTLVLVDGRPLAQAGNSNRGSTTGQGFVDLNAIPLGMIDHIEITTDGASAIYGADAVAGVINIVLKKSWVGSELSGSISMPEHGGGRERESTLTSGFAALGGRLHGVFAIDYYDRDPIFASQRSFSSGMNYSNVILGYNATTGLPVYGNDQRIQWGDPASIQSTATTGFVSIPGIRVLLAPTGSTSTPPVSAFTHETTNAPGQTSTAIIAQGQRVTNPAPWLEMLSASQRRGVYGNATYELGRGLEAYGDYSFSDSRSQATGLPAYVQNVAVSAANNPFGENIQFGMLLPQWGIPWQDTKTQTSTLTAGLRGKWGESWRWDTGFRWEEQNFHEVNRNFNQTAFNALANNADPTQRFNPYVDESVAGAPDQTALLEKTALYPTVDARSGMSSFDASANGDLIQIWGGPVKAAVGGSYERDSNDYTAINYSGYPVVAAVQAFTTERTTLAGYGELSAPLFGKPNGMPLLRRLDVNLAWRFEDLSDAGSNHVPKYGLSWGPFQSLLLRASYSKGYRAPSLTENRRLTTTQTLTVNDPSRGNTPTAVSYVVRSNPNLKPETSTTDFVGAIYEPQFVPGLSLQVNYYDTKQFNAIQSISYVTILANEALFPGYVVRNAPSASDTAAGWPGAINTIYAQYANFGLIHNRSMDYTADYRLPWKQLGTWRLNVDAARTLLQTQQLTVGGVPVNQLGDTYASPKWAISSSVYWKKGPWTASSTLTYMSGFNTSTASVTVSNYPVSAARLLDLHVGYEFQKGVWRGYGKGLVLGLAVKNLMDATPPFLNNIYGFNPGLHGSWVFGRTLELSFRLPL